MNVAAVSGRLAAAVLLFGMAACSVPPAPPRCVRYQVASMGPENGFRITIPEDQLSSLDDPAERINVAATMVPPIVAPVTLIQVVDGKELGKWDIKLPANAGITTRCSIGLTLPNSTCGVSIGDRPHPPGGYYSIEANGNRVLEVGLSFDLCR